MKTCAGCSEPKPLTEFYKDARRSDGLGALCRACTKTKNKAAYERHADARKAAQRERNKRDKESKSTYNRTYREAHRDSLIAYVRNWRAAGNKANRSVESKERQKAHRRLLYATDPAYRERAKAYASMFRRKLTLEHLRSANKRWRANNLDHARKYMRDYQRTFNQTPEGKARMAASRLRHRAKRQAWQATYYAKRYGRSGIITHDYLHWLHKWQDHCCCLCNAPLQQKDTVEHVVPLIRGGENNPHNVLLSCMACQCSRQDRLFDDSEWQPRLTYPGERAHSLFYTAFAAKACGEAGMGVTIEKDRIRLANGKALHVLSTFWMSDRCRPPATVAEIHAMYPGDILTFDHEWRSRPDALLNVVRAKCGQAVSIGARELEVVSPPVDIARAFMDKWHVQGFSGGTWYVGLMDPDTSRWHGMASFRRHGNGYELARLAFSGHVSGGLSRIVSAFMRAAPEPGDLLTYADTRFGSGAGYVAAGFEPDGETTPWYCYVNSEGMHSRQSRRKEEMATVLDWFDPDWPEHRLARVNGLWRLNGLPQKRFVLRAN